MLNHTIAISLESEGNSIMYYATVISRARKTFLRYFNPLDWRRLEICLASLLGSIAFTPRWMDSGDSGTIRSQRPGDIYGVPFGEIPWRAIDDEICTP